MEKMNRPTVPSVAPLQFFKEVKTELGKVHWPSRPETIKLTTVVIAVSAIVGAFIGGLDILFLNITKIIFQR